MEYQCVYEITNDPHWYRLNILFLGIVFLVCFLFEINIWKEKKEVKKFHKIFFGIIFLPLFILSFGAGLIDAGIRMAYKDPKYILEPYQRGEYLTAEGIVVGEDWGNIFWGGDVFWVDNVRFVTASFKNQEIGYGKTASRGGYIKESEMIRIGYIPYEKRNVIVKIDIATE